MHGIIPHRWPMLFLGETLSSAPPEFSAWASFAVGNPYLNGGPVPRPLVIEALAQAVAAGANAERAQKGIPLCRHGVLAMVRHCVFAADCHPGQPVILRVKHTRTFGRLWSYAVEAVLVADGAEQLLCRGNLVAADTDGESTL